MKALAALAFAGLAVTTSWAQAPAGGPPADAFAPDPPKLRAVVAGNTFEWHTRDSGRAAAPNTTARMEFTEGGLVISNLSSGTFDRGTWKVEGANLCFQWQTFSSGCNEVRIAGDTLWLLHANGKWSTMTLIRKPGASRAG
jgi:hypothetical protein